MAKKYSFFDFFGKKVDEATIEPVIKNVLEQVAIKELALHLGISFIANTLSKCEFKVYEKGNEVKNKLYYSLNVSPNPNQNSSQFINQILKQCFTLGSALVIPQNDHIYCADNFEIDDDNPLKENVFSNISFNNYTLKKKIKANEVFFFRLDDDNIKTFIDSIYAQYSQVISLALSAYKRTNGIKYKMILDQYRAGDTAFNQIYNDVLKAQLQSFIDNDNGIYPQFKGVDLQEFSKQSPKDVSDIISMRKEIFEFVAQSLKIPLSMMYGNITNMKEVRSAFLSDSVDPWACMIGEEITRKYFDFNEWQNGSEVVVDTSCVNHIDLFEIMANADKGISSGWINGDEIRRAAGLRELKTDFSTSYFMTKNYTLAENMLNGEEAAKGGE